MNSFFATVEQQANPALLGKPIAVSGRPHIHSIVAAASIEAKRFGVKSGMTTWEAKKLCPSLIFIPGDPAKYMDVSRRLVGIFRSHTPLVEIFSIDEAFLEISDILKPDPSTPPPTGGSAQNDTEAAIKIALKIKDEIKEKIGPRVTCSVGIAKNKLLAKLASEKKKPDGLTIIDDTNLDDMLLSAKLDDFCGIGRKVLTHLQGMGIYSVAQLRAVPVEYLVAAFGVRGEIIRNMALGIDDSPLVRSEEAAEEKSFSHNLTLPKATLDRDYVYSVLLYLSEKVGRRMRAAGFSGKVVHTWASLADLAGFGQQKTLTYYTNDGREIFTIGQKILAGINRTEPIRSVGVGVSGLIKHDQTNISLLADRHVAEKITAAADLVNNRFGEGSVFRGATLPVFERDKDVAGIRMRLRFN